MSLNAWLDENGCHLPKLQKPLEDVDPFINGDSCSSSCSKTVSLDEAVYTDLLPYTKYSDTTEEFIDVIAAKLKDYLVKSNDRNEKIINFLTPDELAKKFDFTLNEDGVPLKDIGDITDQILKYCVKTAHPRFYNQVWAGVDITGLMGQWITTTTNTSMYTYEMAPVYVLMENYVTERLLEYAGFTNGDGMFFPGGSICNMQAMCLARQKYLPNVKEDGMFACKPLVAFTSEECHYSLQKAAATLGIGTKNMRKVKTDAKGKMIMADLEDKIISSLEKGERPFFVNATAGTTVGGAYDPFNEVADLCEKYDMWFHVDGCWGGACLASKKHRGLMKGAERADSLAWDPHKLMNCLLQCAVLLVKEKGIFNKLNAANASYLFQKDKKAYDPSWDTGDKTIQCSRNVDVLKLWLMWKAKGSNGIEAQVDNAFDNSKYLAQQVRKRPDFQLVREPECTNVCLRYIPPAIGCLPDGPEKEEKLGKVPPEIKKRMTLAGTIMISYQPLKEEKNFFRMITVSPGVTHADMDFVLDEIERLGKDLS